MSSVGDKDEEQSTLPPRSGAASIAGDDVDEDAGPSTSRRTARVDKSDDGSNAGKDDDEGDDLFGGGDDDEDDDDDEEDAIKRPSRIRRQRVDSQSPPAASAARPQDSSRQPSFERDMASSDMDDEDERRRKEALELRETSTEPAMGFRDGAYDKEQREYQEASFSVPSLPVRRGLPHLYARLPNLLQYRSDEFDETKFDADAEDAWLQNREGFRIDDAGLRSLLTTNNTIRWRYVDQDGQQPQAKRSRKPQSNARIVRWSDGTSSLQLGSEFYDITTSAERVQAAPSASLAAAKPSEFSQTKDGQDGRAPLVPPQPVQHLTHMFVKQDGQEELNVYQAETPIAASLTFRPTSIASESHQRLVKAVRQQRGALVKETVTREDPELEKERQEREEKKRKQIRAREMRKRKPQDDDEDDAFWASAGRAVIRGGVARGKAAANGVALESAIEEGDVDAALLDSTIAYEDDDDGFVVDDDDDDDDAADDDGGDRSAKGRGRGRDTEMDVDDEPDEIDRMEAEIEKQEARRLANKAGAEKGTSTPADEDATSGARRRRIVESDDDE